MTSPQWHPGEQISLTNAKPIQSRMLADVHDPINHYSIEIYWSNVMNPYDVSRRYDADRKGFCLRVSGARRNSSSRALTGCYSYKCQTKSSREDRLKQRVVRNGRTRSVPRVASQSRHGQNKRAIISVSRICTIRRGTPNVPRYVLGIDINQDRVNRKCGCGRGSATSALTRPHRERRWRRRRRECVQVRTPTTASTPLPTRPSLSAPTHRLTMSIVAMSPEPSAPSSPTPRDDCANHAIVADGGECECPETYSETSGSGNGDGRYGGTSASDIGADDALVESLREVVTIVSNAFVDVKYTPHYIVLGAVALLDEADHIDTVRTGAVQTVTNRLIEDEENERSRRQVDTSLSTLAENGFLDPIKIDDVNAYDWRLSERSRELLESIPLNEDMLLVRALAHSEYTEDL